MILSFRISVFLGALLAIHPLGMADEVDVYLLGGQSNMQGIGKFSQLDAMPEPPPRVFFSQGDSFGPLIPGSTPTSQREGEFGPEIGFAAAIQSEPDAAPVYLIKYAASGMPLHPGWNRGEWEGLPPQPGRVHFHPGDQASDPNTGRLYKEMKDRFATGLATLEQQGLTPRVRGLVWMQGEADSKRAESAGEYAIRLKQLRDRLAADLELNDLPMAFGKVLGDPDPLPRFRARDAIRRQMDLADMGSGSNLAIPRARCVDTDGMDLLPDKVHYSGPGQIALGKAFAAAIREAQASGREVALWETRGPGFPPDLVPGPPSRLDSEHVSEITRPTLHRFPATGPAPTKQAVIVFPGGGYRLLADLKEGDRLSAFLARHGIHAFTLRYRVSREDRPGFEFPGPLLDARQAIRIVRSRAEEWGIDPDQIGIIGFSAGGHLASMAATRFEDRFAEEDAHPETLPAVSARPDFAGLIYPVATMTGELAHRGSRQALFREEATEEELRQASAAFRMTQKTPPLFICHNQFDPVPAIPSLELAIAARRAEVPCELHLYPTGQHGHGMGREGDSRREIPALAWPELFLDFLSRQRP